MITNAKPELITRSTLGIAKREEYKASDKQNPERPINDFLRATENHSLFVLGAQCMQNHRRCYERDKESSDHGKVEEEPVHFRGSMPLPKQLLQENQAVRPFLLYNAIPSFCYAHFRLAFQSVLPGPSWTRITS